MVQSIFTAVCTRLYYSSTSFSRQISGLRQILVLLLFAAVCSSCGGIPGIGLKRVTYDTIPHLPPRCTCCFFCFEDTTLSVQQYSDRMYHRTTGIKYCGVACTVYEKKADAYAQCMKMMLQTQYISSQVLRVQHNSILRYLCTRLMLLISSQVVGRYVASIIFARHRRRGCNQSNGRRCVYSGRSSRLVDLDEIDVPNAAICVVCPLRTIQQQYSTQPSTIE